MLPLQRALLLQQMLPLQRALLLQQVLPPLLQQVQQLLGWFLGCSALQLQLQAWSIWPCACFLVFQQFCRLQRPPEGYKK